MQSYVGEDQKKRYVIPLSYLHEPTFQELLIMAEKETGYEHPMVGHTIPCRGHLHRFHFSVELIVKHNNNIN